jgi:hypothetical protein
MTEEIGVTTTEDGKGTQITKMAYPGDQRPTVAFIAQAHHRDPVKQYIARYIIHHYAKLVENAGRIYDDATERIFTQQINTDDPEKQVEPPTVDRHGELLDFANAVYELGKANLALFPPIGFRSPDTQVLLTMASVETIPITIVKMANHPRFFIAHPEKEFDRISHGREWMTVMGILKEKYDAFYDLTPPFGCAKELPKLLAIAKSPVILILAGDWKVDKYCMACYNHALVSGILTYDFTYQENRWKSILQY